MSVCRFNQAQTTPYHCILAKNIDMADATLAYTHIMQNIYPKIKNISYENERKKTETLSIAQNPPLF